MHIDYLRLIAVSSPLKLYNEEQFYLERAFPVEKIEKVSLIYTTRDRTCFA